VYAKELKQIARIKAKERQTEVLKKGNILPFPPIGGNGANDPHKNETDYIVGTKVGMTSGIYRRAKRVVESGDKELIDKMNKGEISINAAYAQIRAAKVPVLLPSFQMRVCPGVFTM